MYAPLSAQSFLRILVVWPALGFFVYHLTAYLWIHLGSEELLCPQLNTLWNAYMSFAFLGFPLQGVWEWGRAGPKNKAYSGTCLVPLMWWFLDNAFDFFNGGVGDLFSSAQPVRYNPITGMCLVPFALLVGVSLVPTLARIFYMRKNPPRYLAMSFSLILLFPFALFGDLLFRSSILPRWGSLLAIILSITYILKEKTYRYDVFVRVFYLSFLIVFFLIPSFYMLLFTLLNAFA